MLSKKALILYYAELIVSPVLVASLLLTSSLRTSDLVPLFAGGAVAWTLAEYAVHRFVLHDFMKAHHSIHHARPAVPQLEINWQVWAGFVVVYLVAGGAVLAGVLTAYVWYLWVHDCAHHRRGAIPASLLAHHDGHHKWATRNYGVSVTLWDHVFGTTLPR